MSQLVSVGLLHVLEHLVASNDIQCYIVVYANTRQSSIGKLQNAKVVELDEQMTDVDLLHHEGARAKLVSEIDGEDIV